MAAEPLSVHPGRGRLAENFPFVVDHLLRPAEFRKRVLTEMMRPQNEISAGYKVLSGFVMRGLVSTMLTTNFDACLPDALKARQPHIRSIHEVNRSPGDRPSSASSTSARSSGCTAVPNTIRI